MSELRDDTTTRHTTGGYVGGVNQCLNCKKLQARVLELEATVDKLTYLDGNQVKYKTLEDFKRLEVENKRLKMKVAFAALSPETSREIDAHIERESEEAADE